jgi:putative hydrolase of the HAD superfamily
MREPKVIFLDAVGTLFGIRGSVGEIYQAIACQAGVEVSAPSLDQAFRQSFQASPPPAFPDAEPAEIPQREWAWWKTIVQNTFTQVGAIERFDDFNAFFSQLYAYFATSQPWYVYGDVLPALQYWQQQGIELGIVSNFDTRLYAVLEKLELRQFFSSITISAMVGVAKPEQQIFAAALHKHNCTPQQAWHIGDSLQEDYYGAKAVGIRAFLLKR